MKSVLIAMLSATLLLTGCATERTADKGADVNPFFVDYDTPFGVPPFDRMRPEHYLPAFDEGIARHAAEVDRIAENLEDPTFANTVEALERSGALLTKVSSVFYNLLSADTSDTLQEIARQVAPKLAQHRDNIRLNEKLFARIKAVYDRRDSLDLTPEQAKLLEETYKNFVRGGANLSPEQKNRFREINKELSVLTLTFGENVLKETNRFELVIDNEQDLDGLPESVVQAAAEAAKKRGHEGKWVFTIQKPSLIPFLQYSTRRDLREKMFKAYISQGDHDDELDNKSILARIAALRVERANLLGYKTHADYVLEENMAKNPANVYKLLDQVWQPALAQAKKEAADLQKLIDEEGGNFKLMPWDWWFYAEKLRKAKYDLDEDMLRPYFKLENVRAGAFEVAHRLYGLTFEKRTDIPVYHPDVEAFEVKDADGSLIGIYYTDYFPRASKRGGAWMNAYREQHRLPDGTDVRPVVCNVGNFTRPTTDKPALLSLDETETLFHEFGHALHGLLSRCTYESLAGTSVPRDFVELPSQIMENWATHPDVLKLYARHYKTGEPMPDDLIEKLQEAAKFNTGFATVEFMAAAYLDMDWHTLTDPTPVADVRGFETRSMNKIGLIPPIVVRYRSTYFRHIFSGGYSSGYYSYLWSEVLDADAFAAFQENGLFDAETARKFRENILSKGGTEDPMDLYKRFRGREPKIDALLKRKGFI